MEKMKMQTKDLIEENIETLKNMFSEVVTEGRDPEGKIREVIDFERLKEILGDEISTSPEHYEFTWVGKRDARRLAATPINKTLRPCVEESKDWDTTENLYIEGDNLDVLKLLQESYLGKVKMIYIDPPYNTGKDFVYRDNFHQSQEDWKEQTTLVDDENNRLEVNPDSSGRFHSDWCTMMYPRLRLAKNLLRDDGVIFISIDDGEVANIRKLCDEIFSEENFLAQIVWQKIHSTKNDAKFYSNTHEYIICYSKNIERASIRLLPRTESMDSRFKNPDNDLRGSWSSGDLVANGIRSTGHYDVTGPTGLQFNVPTDKHWVYSKDNMMNLIDEGRIWFGKNGDAFPRLKRYLSEVQQGRKADTLWLASEVGHNQESKREIKSLFDCNVVFDTPKPVRLIRRCIDVTLSDNDVILDFFSGSATTAHSVMQLNAEDGGNRKFIMVQVPEKCDEKSEAYKEGYPTICEIGKERIRRAGEKIKKEVEQDNTQLDLGAEPKKTPDIGFRVLKIDSSNMNDVYYGAAELEQQDLFDSESNIKSDRTELDILFGIMLDWGLPLSLPYKKEMIGNTVIHNVEEGALIACFSDAISEEVVIAIAKRQATKVVFKDSCFSSSVDRINVEQLFKHYDPTFASNSDKIRVI
ncbi:MAG: site-specific DNA-methyltransferase [Sphaerochaeta sp.]|nr:site-specific DNA-methyltransferase [Sphaerochaeta sp.]